MVVLDTSVLAKWFLPEADSALALAVRQAHLAGRIKVVIPDFALLELGNVPRFKFPPADENLAVESVKSVTAMNVQVIATTPDLASSAVKVAYARDLTVYDGLFVALAEVLGFELITTDEHLADRCRGMGVVRLLREWQAP